MIEWEVGASPHRLLGDSPGVFEPKRNALGEHFRRERAEPKER